MFKFKTNNDSRQQDVCKRERNGLASREPNSDPIEICVSAWSGEEGAIIAKLPREGGEISRSSKIRRPENSASLRLLGLGPAE